MTKRLLLCVLLLASSSLALAATPKETGFYLGAGYGMTMFDDDGAFSGLSFDDTDSGYQVFGGYKFMRFFALEARYSDFGSFSVMSFPFDVTGYSLSAVGILPLGAGNWELFGQLGFGQVDLSLPGESSSNEGVMSGGFGVRYNFTEQWSVGGQINVYVWEDSSIGTTYDLAVSDSSITIQYAF
ncbi:MAG: outer membrane beta-barrel protein [Gammaproteobacteria bacterium]|jgi:OOP family OmpA-OmpF porin|nr:outer membrane beta-barrel protein [Gammaproteobacteria bacterium]